MDALQETWINVDPVEPDAHRDTPSTCDPAIPPTSARLQKFEPWHAFDVARWARTSQELWWLAPNTAAPLTVSKVLGWKREQGFAYILSNENEDAPIGYGELNPMRDDRRHFWLGHIVVRPDRRRGGLGKSLLRSLLVEAFEHRGAERVSLIVFPDNLPAIRCYRAVGMSAVGDELHQFRGSGPRHKLSRMQITAWGFFEVHFDGLHTGSVESAP